MKKCRLADLYVTGVPCVLKNEKGTKAAEVWVQKPGQVEHDASLRRANAARARVLMFRNDPDSEDWQAAYSEVVDFGDRDQIIDYIISKKAAERRQTVQARIAAEEPWSEDDYLQGIYDAWEGDGEDLGLKAVYARDPEDPEALRIFNEMKKFRDAVDEQLNPEIDLLRQEQGGLTDEEVRRRATDRLLESKADQVWLRELNRSELFYAVREPEDHSERYFSSRAELELIDPRIIGQLADAYRDLVVDPDEGKDSAGTGDSSASSEPPETEATEPSSGLAIVSP